MKQYSSGFLEASDRYLRMEVSLFSWSIMIMYVISVVSSLQTSAVSVSKALPTRSMVKPRA